MDTRCGAAMTLAMPCIIGMLFVYIFGADNILTIKTLLPELEIEEIRNPSSNINMYGNISLQIETLAYTGALGDQSCVDIEAIDSGTQLKCSSTNFTNTTSSKDIVLCSTNVVCIVDNRLTGIQDIVMKFPVAFQKMQWSVQPGKKWYNSQTEIKATLVSDTKEIFSGTETDPTKLNFAIVRGKLSTKTTRKTIYSIKSTNKTDFGLQLTWRGSNLQQSKEGPSTPFHYVAFKFAVAENVFNVELLDEKDLIALFTAVLTLFLSIISFMKIVKIFGAKYLDAYLRWKNAKNGTAIPEDVLRRQRVLDEHNLTAKGTRRLSSVRNVLERLEDEDTDDDEEEMEIVDFENDGDGNKVVKNKNWKPNPLGRSSMEVEMAELGTVSTSSPPLPPRSSNSNGYGSSRVVKKRIVTMKPNQEKNNMRQEIIEIKQQMKQQTQQMKQQTQQMKRTEHEKQKMQEQISEMQQILKKLTENTSHLL